MAMRQTGPKLSAIERMRPCLNKRFPNNDFAPKYYGDLLAEYLGCGLSPPHVVREIETDDEGKFWSCVWEALLFRHLNSAGYKLKNVVKRSGQKGPDFCVEIESQRIWIEAVVPSPEGIPASWLEPPTHEPRVRSKPDAERVLRCTSVIADKQRKFAHYLETGIVEPHDVTVVAVNICRLSDWDVDGCGISQLPLTMEAVFPIGPLGVPISLDGSLAGPARNLPRPSVPKNSGIKIQTANFLDPKFANISAILQAHERWTRRHNLGLSVIHNPLAKNPLPRGQFGCCSEFVAEQRGDHYRLTDLLLGSAHD